MHVQCKQTIWVWPMISHRHSVALPIPLPTRLLMPWRPSLHPRHPTHFVYEPSPDIWPLLGEQPREFAVTATFGTSSPPIHVCPPTPPPSRPLVAWTGISSMAYRKFIPNVKASKTGARGEKWRLHRLDQHLAVRSDCQTRPSSAFRMRCERRSFPPHQWSLPPAWNHHSNSPVELAGPLDTWQPPSPPAMTDGSRTTWLDMGSPVFLRPGRHSRKHDGSTVVQGGGGAAGDQLPTYAAAQHLVDLGTL